MMIIISIHKGHAGIRRMAGRKPNRQLLARPPHIGRRSRRENELWFAPPLPGWPGWRTRLGRSGFDPIDYRLELAHMWGVLLREFFTFRFRSRNPIVLIVLLWIGLGLSSHLLTLLPVLTTRSNVIFDRRVVIDGWLLFSFLLDGLYFVIGAVILANVAKNMNNLMEPLFKLLELDVNDSPAIEQCATLLVEGFKEHWPDSWPDMESARREVREMLAGDRICRIAIDRAGNVVGWIGGIPEYDGHVWELHPLVVKPDQQMQGIGRMLVRDFEQEVKRRGGFTLMLGTDDEDSMTSLANADLYRDTWDQIAEIENLKGHPYEFYRKVGFTIVGVVPNANGRGKPDILMAKRVG